MNVAYLRHHIFLSLSLSLEFEDLALLAQLSSELFIKRSAYTKVVGIHNIQKLDLKILGKEGWENSLAISNKAFTWKDRSRGSIQDFHG